MLCGSAGQAEPFRRRLSGSAGQAEAASLEPDEVLEPLDDDDPVDAEASLVSEELFDPLDPELSRSPEELPPPELEDDDA